MVYLGKHSTGKEILIVESQFFMRFFYFHHKVIGIFFSSRLLLFPFC